jgi:hypothetical protein
MMMMHGIFTIEGLLLRAATRLNPGSTSICIFALLAEHLPLNLSMGSICQARNNTHNKDIEANQVRTGVHLGIPTCAINTLALIDWMINRTLCLPFAQQSSISDSS